MADATVGSEINWKASYFAALEERDAVRADNERLRKALKRSLNWLSSYPGGLSLGAYDEARAALDSKDSPPHTGTK